MLNDDQVKILQAIDGGASSDEKIVSQTGLSIEQVRYYLKDFDQNDYLNVARALTLGGEQGYPSCYLTPKGKVAAKDLSKLLPSSLSLAGITITNSQGVVINFGEINGDVSNSINQLKEQNTSEAAELAKLLEQLQTSLNADTDLKDEDKADALERVKVLAEVGKPKDGAMRRVANTAIKVVRGTVTALPPTTKLIENVNNLLHEITKLLDLS